MTFQKVLALPLLRWAASLGSAWILCASSSTWPLVSDRSALDTARGQEYTQ